MRVKLSYTAEVDEVLQESAYMLKNLSETINNTINNYNELLKILGEEETFNSTTFFKKLDDIRHALGRLDYRLVEVSQIVSGYESYAAERRQKALEDDSPSDSERESSLYVEEEVEDVPQAPPAETENPKKTGGKGKKGISESA
tara:strand:+ start:559 stop:990 length:432 start_codon:yes stop_codon:yes gene_type:complete